MTRKSNHRHARGRSASRRERGHLMAGLMAAVAILMIFSAVAFQAWTEVLRRDNEAEMMFRAQDLVRAIQRYRKDHGGLGPEKLEDLMEPGPRGQYYLRRLYTDPLVPDGKWGLLYMGPGGAIIDPSAEPAEGGLAAGLGGGLGSGTDRLGGGTPGASKQPGQRKAPGARRLDPGSRQGARGGQLGGIGNPQTGSGEMAGLRIAGVKSLSEDTPFRVYNGLTEYSQWQFTYLDLEQQKLPGQGRPGGKQPQQPGGLGGRGPGQNPGRVNQPGNAGGNRR